MEYQPLHLHGAWNSVDIKNMPFIRQIGNWGVPSNAFGSVSSQTFTYFKLMMHSGILIYWKYGN